MSAVKVYKPENLTDSEKADILKELEADHEKMWANQRRMKRRWVMVQNAVKGRQLYPEGSMGLDNGSMALGWMEAGASDPTMSVDQEHAIWNELRRVKNVDQQRLTSYFMRPEVVPNSKDPDDKEAARIARIVLSDHIRRHGEARIKAVCADHLIFYNIVIGKVKYEPSAGQKVRKPVEKQVKVKVPLEVAGIKIPLATTTETQTVLSDEWVAEGDMVWEFPNPKNVLIPKYTARIEDADEVEEYHLSSVEKIYRDFGVVVEAESVSAEYYEGLDYQSKRDTEGWSESEKEVKNKVILKEKVVMPCPRYPEGAVFTWTKKQLIRSDKLRYPGNPYFSAQLQHDGELAYVDSILWDLMPIQGFLNLTQSAKQRWLRMISLLRRWIPASAKIKPEDLSNATAMNGFYEGETPPEWEKIPEINESIFRLYDEAREAIQTHGYSNDLTKQKRAMSGNALGILQEMDDTIFKPALENLGDMFTRMSLFHCMVAAECITTSRLAKMSRRQGWESAIFKGEMLKAGGYHVNINLMAGMPSNKVLRLEYLRQLYKDELVPKEEIQQFLEFPSDTQPLEDVQKQYEIVDARIKGLLDFENYEEKDDGSGTKIFQAPKKFDYQVYDNHALFVMKLQETLQEQGAYMEPWVKLTVLSHWKWQKDMLAAMLKAPVPSSGGGATSESGSSGLDEALGGELGADSNQNASDQPDRGAIPPPMNSGLTATQ